MTREDLYTLYSFAEAVILDVEASRTIGAAGSETLARAHLTSATNVAQATIDVANAIGEELNSKGMFGGNLGRRAIPAT